MLTTEAHEVLRPRFPVIDAHNHLGDAFLTWSDDWLSRPVSQLIATMDESGVRAIVDLDGRWGDLLRAELARPIRTASPSSPGSTTTISRPTPVLVRRRQSAYKSRWRSARAD
jgi:hypothetical protein